MQLPVPNFMSNAEEIPPLSFWVHHRIEAFVYQDFSIFDPECCQNVDPSGNPRYAKSSMEVIHVKPETQEIEDLVIERDGWP